VAKSRTLLGAFGADNLGVSSSGAFCSRADEQERETSSQQSQLTVISITRFWCEQLNRAAIQHRGAAAKKPLPPPPTLSNSRARAEQTCALAARV